MLYPRSTQWQATQESAFQLSRRVGACVAECGLQEVRVDGRTKLERSTFGTLQLAHCTHTRPPTHSPSQFTTIYRSLYSRQMAAHGYNHAHRIALGQRAVRGTVTPIPPKRV